MVDQSDDSSPSVAPSSDADHAGELAELSDAAFAYRFLASAMWRPLDVPETAWWGHIPTMFAFVDLLRPTRLVELGTHRGASFFAACQAVDRLGLATELYAVDTWEGEIHTGRYDESVYTTFVDVLERRGYTGATPLRMLFDEAVARFEPGSIDVLHIDGLHTFEAVSRDLDTWIDRVMPGGLVLFHDVRVHEKDFGVWRLWNELEADARYRTFSFDHSHGLGVLQTPGEGFPQLTRLIELLRSNPLISEHVQLLIETVAELDYTASKLQPAYDALSANKQRRIELEAELTNARSIADRGSRELQDHLREAESDRAVLDEELARLRDEVIQLRGARDDANQAIVESRERIRSQTRATHRHRTRANLIARARAKAEIREGAIEAETIERLRAVEDEAGLVRRLVRARHAPTSASETVAAVRAQVRLEHLVADLRASGLFDQNWYEEQNPDIAASDPLVHYVVNGRWEGRRPNEFFDPEEYFTANPRLRGRIAEALEHYLYVGGFELREIGGSFDSRQYTLEYDDDVLKFGNPLGHYLTEGRAKGYVPAPPAPRDERRRKSIDRKTDREETLRLLTEYAARRDQVDEVLVSVVMPTYNRAHQIGRAVESVLAQTHQNFELLIVDDGSTDSTSEAVERYARDARVTYLRRPHEGVSAARNAGLDAASGQYVAYLDTDNEWMADFLRLLVTHLLETGARSAYSAMVSRDERGRVVSYLSSEFDWDACYEGNYVDLNVFVHERDPDPDAARFEPQLRRMVDWDFILRLTRRSPAVHTPFVGCTYNDTDDPTRISRSGPLIYREFVRRRNDPGIDVPPSFDELAEELVLHFAIRIGAPWAKRHAWGDYHYAEALAAALRQLGHEVRIVFHDDGPRLSAGPADEVNIVLRGLTEHGPIPGNLNILWVISHPQLVTSDEMASYNMVYLASESHAALVAHDRNVSPRFLPQGTAFAPPAAGVDHGSEVVFVGNSRRVSWPIVEWAVEAGLPLELYGKDWESTPAADAVRATYYPNELLPERYASARVVLNDHWDSMRDFGYVSNRILDVLASGGTVVSDVMPAIDRLLDDAVAQVASAEALAKAVDSVDTPTEEKLGRAAQIREAHGFDARARQLLNDIYRYLRLPERYPGTPAVPSRTVRVGSSPPVRVAALFMSTRLGFQSSAFVRVLAPLTTEAVYDQIDVSATGDPGTVDVASTDVVLVQRTALTDVFAAKDLTAAAREAGVPVVLDLDDAFADIEPGTDQYELYRDRVPALRHLVAESDAVTVSTPDLAEALGMAGDPRLHVVENTLDPRLWSRYARRLEVDRRRAGEPLQVLYMGTATHDDDFAHVLPALDDWASSEDIELTVVGAVRDVPDRDWITRLDPPPGAGLYPRFAGWLSRLPRFDIGIAPLEPSVFNSSKSDIKFLDYCAIGAIPVLSRGPAYGAPVHEALGYVADATTESWVDALAAAADEARTAPRVKERLDYLWSERTADRAGHRLLEVLASVGVGTGTTA